MIDSGLYLSYHGSQEAVPANISSDTTISISEANQNFSKVPRFADQLGSAPILKNNAPRYAVMKFSQAEKMQIASDGLVLASSEKLMKRNRKVHEAPARRKFSAENGY